MKRKLIPIKTLIKKVEKLSTKPKANKNQLLKYSNLIKNQNELMSRVSINKIKNKLQEDLTFEEYCKYKDLLQEKKNYKKYRSTINNIVDRKYNTLNKKRRIKRRKLRTGIITGVFIATLSTLGYVTFMKNMNKKKNDNNIKAEISTELTTTDEPQTINYTEVTTTENTTETTTEATTVENTTETTTEATTENKTEATTVKKEEPTTVTYTFITDNQEKNKNIDNEEILNKKIEELEKKQKELEEQINKTEQSTTEATTEVITTETTTETTTEITDNNIEFDDGVIDYSKFSKLKDFYNTASGYIETMENTIIDDEKRNEAKENAKGKVIEYIDFIFYGNEINGVTFDELKEDEKEKAYEQLQTLNEKISEKDPDYLNNMGERYSRLKDLGSLTLQNAKNKVREKVGDEYYNDADQVKDDTFDTIKETGGLIKKFIKEKYEEWRD